MAYAIISVGGKQYRVQEGEKLTVDRLKTEEGKTLNPMVLLFGDDKKTELSPQSVTVTARVVGHVKGEKIRIGKYKKRTGYKRHTGFRASLTELQIEKIGARGSTASKTEKTESPAKPAASAASAPAKPAAAKAPAKGERVAGMPKDYEELTVAGIVEAAPGWRRPMLEAALEFERANAARKGAIAALESALASKEEH
jgi:large subunit ribosomal protein L21